MALTYALGFERDLRGAPTGDRVFALIGAGSGAVGIIAAHGAPNALAGAITGVGFIGGGLVFRQTLGQNQVLMGITTAAAIFAAAAIGAAAGEGRVLVATMGTALSLLVLEIRHSKVLNLLDGRRYADKFKQDSQDPHLPATRSRTRAPARPRPYGSPHYAADSQRPPQPFRRSLSLGRTWSMRPGRSPSSEALSRLSPAAGRENHGRRRPAGTRRRTSRSPGHPRPP